MRVFLSILMVVSTCLFTDVALAATRTLLNGSIATGAGTALQIPQSPPPYNRTFQAFGTTASGTGACAVKVQASNDGVRWLDLGTITLTLGTSSTNDGFASQTVWPYVRGNVSSISGTGAACSLTVGY